MPVSTDGSASAERTPRHPHAVSVEMRDEDGFGVTFWTTVWVGETEDEAVDVDAAIYYAEARHPGSLAQDWRGL